jgi:hypothetical protein
MATIPDLNLTQSSLGLNGTSDEHSQKCDGSLRHSDSIEGPTKPTTPHHPHLKTANSFAISPELFEKMYLTPQNQVKGDLRKTFGNPTPL